MSILSARCIELAIARQSSLANQVSTFQVEASILLLARSLDEQEAQQRLLEDAIDTEADVDSVRLGEWITPLETAEELNEYEVSMQLGSVEFFYNLYH
jgi:hypothetical protein